MIFFVFGFVGYVCVCVCVCVCVVMFSVASSLVLFVSPFLVALLCRRCCLLFPRRSRRCLYVAAGCFGVVAPLSVSFPSSLFFCCS